MFRAKLPWCAMSTATASRQLSIMGDGYVSYAEPDPPIRPGHGLCITFQSRAMETAHGIGVGDINGDGRMDILNMFGWWEHPPAGSDQSLGSTIRRCLAALATDAAAQ